MSVIGIDFGSQNCVIAQAKRGGVETILNESSSRKTPNMVSLQFEERFMGASAVPLARSNCKNTVSYVKRVFGRKFADPALEVEKKFIPIESQLTEAPNGSVGIQLRYGSNNMVFSTESVAAMMLKKLQKTIAVANNGRSGGDVVVTVPGYWTDAQRRGILNACDIAQVKCVGLVNENTVFAGFDPKFNAITGLNGSGKSNILDSICFVLGITNLKQVRVSNLQELVYKQGQAGVTRATVTIVFDNADPTQTPVGYEQYDQITITRQIVIGGRNKYLINGHVAQVGQVQNLFHSS